jgi:nucleoside phosphorylase
MEIVGILMPLAAMIKELEIGNELHGSKFENYLLKNRCLSIWKNNKTVAFFPRKEQNELSSEIFIYSLNSFIDREVYVDEDRKKLAQNFNIYFHLIFKYHIDNVTIKKDYSEFVEEIKSLNQKGLIQSEILSKIEKLIKDKKYTNAKEEVEEKLKEHNKEGYQFDYAIITALEDDEMEKVLPLIIKEGEVEDSNNYIEYGYLKDKPDKKIVYASQHNTGMVDASILASELIMKFKPKFLIMVGVLGGKPADTNIGDVVIANKVFEIDRGKLTELGFKKESSVANLKSREILKINRNKKEIENFIKSVDETRKSKVQLHFGPIACVNQVIDVKDFFQENISSIDRKAIALEMESFAVVRACELLNNGETKPLIIKSVMDNTQEKTDEGKTYAAWTSAKTLEYILLHDII